MDFYRKYELIEPLPGEGCKSFQGRQVSTGREVTIHLLVGGAKPENEALLVRLRGLPPESHAQLVEVGDNGDTKFVVTAAPPYLHLEAWLSEQEGGDRLAGGQEFTRAGAWKVPPSRPEPGATVERPAHAPDTPAPAPPGEITKIFQAGEAATLKATSVPSPTGPPVPPGEFTRMFQSPIAASTGQMPAVGKPSDAPPPVASTASASAEPGDFTRIFKAPIAASTGQMPAATRPPDAPPPAASTAPASPEPGDFTRIFKAPLAASTGEMPAAPAPLAPPTPAAGTPSGAPGEFTRMFQSPLPRGAAPGDWPPPEPKPAEAGAFTSMFRPPAASAGPTAGSEPRQGGDFTQFFKPQPGTPPGPEMPSASAFPATTPPMHPAAPSPVGDFTRMFKAPVPRPEVPPPVASAAPPPVARTPVSGSATQAFRLPDGPPTTPPLTSGPSEYTRMLSRADLTGGAPVAPQVPERPAYGMPPNPYAQAPQMPVVQMPVVQMPVAQIPMVAQPMVQMPTVPQPMAPQLASSQLTPAARTPGNNWLLMGIFMLLALLVGGLTVYFLMRH